MKEALKLLKDFPKDGGGLYIVYELFTFDNIFRLLLENGFDHEESLRLVLLHCSLSALVYQERIHNKRYRELSAKDALPANLAACKAQLIYDLMSLSKHGKRHY
jgi:hypothetical protein